MTTKTPTPLFKDTELKLFSTYIPTIHNYLEFGAGNSTKFMNIQPTVHSITSVETDRALINELIDDPALQPRIRAGTLRLIHNDIDAVGSFGYPLSTNNHSILLNYTLKSWPSIIRPYDTVLIDGRFRLATAMLALIYLPDAQFFFHDFLNRPFYFPLLPYINIVDYAETLIHYVIRNGIAPSQILNEALKHLFDPR